MPEIISFPTAALVFAAGLVRLSQIRPTTPAHARHHMHIALFAIAAALVFATPAVQDAIRSVVPVPYVARLATNLATLVAAFSLVVTVVGVTAGPDHAATRRRKKRLASALLVALTITTLGLASTEAIFESYFCTTEPDLEYVLSQVACWGFLSGCAVRLILLMSRYLTQQEIRPRMRWAMLLVVIAAAVGMVWIAFDIVGVALIVLDYQGAGNLAAVSDVLAATAAVLVSGGVALPIVATRSRRIVRRRRTTRLLRAITPMWRALTTTIPTVVLQQHVLDGDPRIALYRRVVEIRDAELLLMKYAPSGIRDLVASTHHRWRPHRVGVQAEAVALSLALDRYRASAQPCAASATAHYPSGDATDLLREARWLVRVHRAIRTAKVVKQVRQLTDPLCERSRS